MSVSTLHRISFCVSLTVAVVLGSSIPAGAAATGAPAPDTSVDVALPRVLAPIVVNGRLQGYAYMTISLIPTSPGQILGIREKVHFLQDAFVRELNRGSIQKPDNPSTTDIEADVDVEATKARLMARVLEIVPKGAVKDLRFDQIVFAPLKPE